MEQKIATMQITDKSTYVSIAFTGNLEYGLIEEIKKQLQAQSLQAELGFILDMSRVKNIDSTGFGMIVNFAKKVSIQNKKIVIIVVDNFVRKLFAISQCDKIFPIVENEKEALQVIQGNSHTELSINDY
ncbi:STAS domain-containing protein [Metasolibacillus sp.]|uniref:STAS domain-containing protein n=1 Tax=Metasolibacillus sp. TaxID=2703680 RepID=UPI0025F9B70D|nr:STAS domain-containing protein [Metasolibacillus sp.]MCT6923924.1 STAS domain-containing protein [Metasolibacillus sp.]MCT6940462.1 STAS domain-containing protein [Metasolibacillus sp.]